MQEVLTLAQTISPLGVIAILVIIVFRLIVDKPLFGDILGIGKKISEVQDIKYPELQKHLEYLEESYANQKKFQENHSMHEIPAIVEAVNRIEIKIDKIADIQYTQGMDIARLKALSEK